MQGCVWAARMSARRAVSLSNVFIEHHFQTSFA
jgi:hypothetical protein